ncbi:MAG: protein translocase subunit SecF [Clostridia bacterium]|nr:protein translocase subunit SecF [Clostridia bacterium]
MKFSFVKNKKVFFVISLVLVVAAIITFAVRGFNWDIEFVGGTEFTFKLDNKATGQDEKKIEDATVAIIGTDSFSSTRVVNGNEVVVRTTLVDTETDYEELNKSIDAKIVEKFADAKRVSASAEKVVYTIPAPVSEETETETETENANETETETKEEFDPSSDIAAVLGDGTLALKLSDIVKNADGNYEITYTANSEVSLLRSRIEKAVNELYPIAETSAEKTRMTSSSTVSAEVSDSLKQTAVTATAVAILLMLVYIAIRFEGRAAFAAIICLAHDVVIMLFAYSIFQIPVSSTIIAAILTILGYSINATIVIFDRIRENRRNLSSNYTFEDAVNSGIKSTIWRSLNTTITTLLTIGMIYILGVTSIKNFALPLIVGIISGVYSSICLSGNLWVALKNVGKKR